MKNKAYKIDAYANRIDEVTVGEYTDIYLHIGCDTFTIADQLPNGDTLYVDDEGYLNASVTRGFFWNGSFFAGCGLLLGSNDEGESVDVKTSELDVAESTNFPPQDFEIDDALRERALNSWSVAAW